MSHGLKIYLASYLFGGPVRMRVTNFFYDTTNYGCAPL